MTQRKSNRPSRSKGDVVNRMISRVYWFVGRNDGQTAPEYALVLTLVTASCASFFAALGGHVTSVVQQVAGLLP